MPLAYFNFSFFLLCYFFAFTVFLALFFASWPATNQSCRTTGKFASPRTFATSACSLQGCVCACVWDKCSQRLYVCVGGERKNVQKNMDNEIAKISWSGCHRFGHATSNCQNTHVVRVRRVIWAFYNTEACLTAFWKCYQWAQHKQNTKKNIWKKMR